MKKLIILSLVILCSTTAFADFSVGPTLGTFMGFGVTARYGFQNMGAEMAITYKPLLIFEDSYNDDDSLEILSSADFGAYYYYLFADEQQKFKPGLITGARYNTLLGVGFSGGFKGILKLNAVTLDLNAGFTIYPDGQDNVLDEEPQYYDVDEFGTTFDLGINVSIMFDIL